MSTPTIPPIEGPASLRFPGPRMYNGRQSIDLCMLVTVLGREAGNQPRAAIEAVGCSIRNRVKAALARWGRDWEEVIEKRWQYSSMNGPANDPNLLKYPNLKYDPWPLCLEVAETVYSGDLADPTGGAHSYFDKSLDADPPQWSIDGEYVKTYDVGAFHFFRLSSL
jgi:hypothetical protein